ncbi:MAG: hypothetical protein ABI389_05480 [Rhodanobacter sp.]
MAGRRPAWMTGLYTLSWALLLALLPWWLGLPALLALAAAVALLQSRLEASHARLIRRALRWGLPGWLLGLQYALGGDLFAWGAALLGALAGYTLLAGLEAWLDRELRRAPATKAVVDWPELVRGPIGPAAEIIELQLPAWQSGHGELFDPQGGVVNCGAGGCHFSDGEQVAATNARLAFAQVGFSPEGRWFAASTSDQRVLVLWDRLRDRRHRLRGWQLCGWYREQPWLSRHDGDVPLALRAVLGHDDD